jgi:hypothetical protein
MNRTLLLASAAVLVLSAGGVASAKSGQPSMASPKGTFAPHTVFKTPKGSVTLYDQNSNDSGSGIVSDNFDSGSFPSYTDQAADDFTVPSGHKWIVGEVDVTGVYFNGPGPADGVNVFFYKDKKGKPGKLVKEIDGATYTDNGIGSFAVQTGKVKLKQGKYWVSVQADMNFSGGAGEWGWEVNTVQTGNPAMWQNPGGGFAVCPTWDTLQTCLGFGPDLMFALKGKDKG